MGDFSIRCAISGIPIPHRTPVLAIPMGKSERHPGYRFPLEFPVAGVMGDYGRIDGNDDGRCIHVLPDMWKAAGDIWSRAMFVEMGHKAVPSIVAEFDGIREKMAEYRASFKAMDAAEVAKILPGMCGIILDKTEWGRRLSHIILFSPDFGKTLKLMVQVVEWAMQEATPDPEELRKLQEFISGFMSSCIVGRDLLGGEADHPFEQYPTLKVDLEWAEAIVAQIKALQKAINHV